MHIAAVHLLTQGPNSWKEPLPPLSGVRSRFTVCFVCGSFVKAKVWATIYLQLQKCFAICEVIVMELGYCQRKELNADEWCFASHITYEWHEFILRYAASRNISPDFSFFYPVSVVLAFTHLHLVDLMNICCDAISTRQWTCADQ